MSLSYRKLLGYDKSQKIIFIQKILLNSNANHSTKIPECVHILPTRPYKFNNYNLSRKKSILRTMTLYVTGTVLRSETYVHADLYNNSMKKLFRQNIIRKSTDEAKAKAYGHIMLWTNFLT